MIGEDFTFGTAKLSDYNMIMAMPDDEQEFVTRAINRAEITSVRPRPNHYGVTYEDTLALHFFIVKSSLECDAQQGSILTGDDINTLRAWLESPKRPTELTVQMGVEEPATHYFGLFTSVQPHMVADECYGLDLTFTCDSPYGYSDEDSLTVTIGGSSQTKSATYNNKTAEMKEYIMPIITINSSSTFGSNESLSIINTSDGNKTMSVLLPSGKSKIVIDCQKKIVTDGSGNLIPMDQIGINNPITGEYNFISTDTYLFRWLSFIPGTNALSFTPSSTNRISTVKIDVRYIIKSGGF